MTTYEITVDGQHAATVHVRDQREILDHVHAIRQVWDTPNVEVVDGETFTWYDDPEEGGIEIVAHIVRMH